VTALRIRRADLGDADFLASLAAHEDVEPLVAPSTAADREAVVAEIELSQAEPEAFGRFVVEVEQDGAWRRAGALGFHAVSRHSRIAKCEGLAVHPDFRGRRIADAAARLLQRELFDELGYHRLELECYGFNERAMRHAERVGFVREGVKRHAYWRHGRWNDGVLYGLLREDLEPETGGERRASP
jgi:RimJ/RimL family protein N-acetyltransferase